METSEHLPPGFVIAGRFVVERLLAEGGMGAIYRARHADTGERLAVKIFRPEMVTDAGAVERFLREARTSAQIDSEHIVRVVEAGAAAELSGAPFLAMELLEGRDLQRESAARGPLPPADVLSFLRQAASALDRAHPLGIVHRDLKPANLFLAQRPDGSATVKVLDFGIAKLTGGAAAGMAVARTATGAVLGTPLYMAPEQASGDNARVSPGTDVWALGLIAHRLLTGKDFWVFAHLGQLLLLITRHPIAAPSARSPWLEAAFPSFDAWFARCCARAPEARFASAGEAVEALAPALGLDP